MRTRRSSRSPTSPGSRPRRVLGGRRRDELRIPRCDACGRLHWYPETECRHCDGEAFTWETMSGRGTLFSWVVVTHAFLPQFADLVPFVPALVALDEDPERAHPHPHGRLRTRRARLRHAGASGVPPASFTGVDGSTAAPLFVPA